MLLRLIVIPVLIFILCSCKERYYQSAFVSDRDGNLDIFLSFNKGEYLNITNDKDVEYGLSWSPDGNSLVYAKQINNQYDLFLLDLKTYESRQLTADTFNQYGPSFSPEGNLIGFVSDMDSKLNEIYTLNLRSGEIIRITNNDLMDSSPTFHPDKQHIYYVTFMDRDSLNRIGNGELFVTDLAGSFHKRITNQPGNDGNPDISPDGKTIAYNNFKNGKADIIIMTIDGSGITYLTNDTLDNRWPGFTPDGKSIAYTRVAGKNSDIWMMDYDGNNKKEFITSIQRDEILELRPIKR
jgi:Tol biopolymer transport system component